MTDDAASARECSVLVTGDVVMDHYLYVGSRHRPGSTILVGTVVQDVPGGAALLYRLLREVAAQQPGLSVSFGFPIAASNANGHCVMRPFEKEPKSKERVWRMADPLGFGAGEADPDPAAVNHAALAQDHSIVVLDDAGLSFRRWPASGAWPEFLVNSARALPEWLIIKMSSPVASGDLWHALVSEETQALVPKSVRRGGDLLRRTIAVISINDLRVEPIHVSGNLSWERTALDLAHELRGNPRLAGLRRLRFVVVSLDMDGIFIVEFPREGDARFRLIFDPAGLEGTFAARIPGKLIGYQTCLTAALVWRLASIRSSDADASVALEEGAIAGLCAKRRYLELGHGPVASGNDSLVGFPQGLLAEEIAGPKPRWSYGSVTIPPRERSDRWTIIEGKSTAAKATPLWGLARRVARQGTRQLKETPYLQVGKLFSIERSEIESLRMLDRLLKTYKGDEKATKPLSIAAFGPPGSGKSFGVKELAKAIFSDDVPLLEFNLAQFPDPSELHGLLHQVRDCVLRGELPIVFWDEFDSQGLRWLQYLLAPMQDGTFQEGPITHPIGKCVFVLAGGTSPRFEEFGESDADFKAKKGPDFKSRLAGYINVVGPNRRDEHDITFPVRRALLLRFHLGVGPDARMTIDPGLLAAFLKIDEYRHGARSLEKIAQQVRLAGHRGEFTRSDLPSRTELDLHVVAERFLNLVESET